jgi:hypothetical protein
MNILRATRFTLQRQLWLNRRPTSNYDACNGHVRLCGRRRRFTESTTAPSGPLADENIERALEKFTSYGLNSHLLPLGTMNDGVWEDMIAAIDHWAQMGSGMAVDSAERLLQRLVYEHAVSSPNVVDYDSRTKTLVELQKLVLQSWLHVHESNKDSKLALSKAEKALITVTETDASGSDSFPIQEFLVVLEGWMRLRTLEGARNAAKLLLTTTDHGKHTDMADFSSDLSPYFGRSLTIILEKERESDIDTDSGFCLELVERMHVLKDRASWSDMELPESSQRIMLEASLSQQEEPDGDEKIGISSFEAEKMQKKMIELLKMYGEGDQDAVNKMEPKLEGITPSKDLVLCLVDFYVRVGDAEKASSWLLRLDIQAQQSSTSDDGKSRLDQVLEAWSQQLHPRGPWRADEIFRHVLNATGTNNVDDRITVGTFNRLLSIWINSNDPAASRKVRDWFSQMLQMNLAPDATSLKLVLSATGSDGNTEAVEAIAARVLKQWGTLGQSDKEKIAEATVEALAASNAASKFVIEILNRLKGENLQVSNTLFRNSLQAIASGSSVPSEVMQIFEILEQLSDGTDIDLYQIAIQALFKSDRDAKDEIDLVYTRAIENIKTNRATVDSERVGDFLLGVINMHAYRKWYTEAESCLVKAEEALLSEAVVKDETSLIPVDCYKRMINRKWFTAQNVPRVIETFQRLLRFYNSGYSNLRPDRDIFTGYIKACATVNKDSGAIDTILDEMLQLYKESGDESCKPDNEIFNALLLAYKHDTKTSKVAGEKSMALLNRMLNLDIQPDTRTINFVMQNVIRSGGKDSYSMVVDLYHKLLEENDLQPDSHTLHTLLDACGSAEPGKHKEALNRCLETFGDIRQKEATGQFTYGILTKVLRRIVQQGPRADKVVSSALQLCCEDGFLNPPVKNTCQAMMTRDSWKRVYTSRLSDGKEEPTEWSRNVVANDASKERAA